MLISVLCGGDSKEREVSLRSGQAVYEALKISGFNVNLIDLKKFDDVENLKCDVAFIALHGGWGEDGTIQKKLHDMKIKYTGSDYEASSIAMNKFKSCELFKSAGLRVPEGFLNKYSPELGSSIIVKPCSGGSTVGITIINGVTEKKFNDAVNFAKSNYAGDVLIEKYIPGRELTAAVWEKNNIVEALPVIEIIPHSGFYDYKNKYTAGATDYIVPAKISDEVKNEISDMAVKAHKILKCKSYSRADFRLSPDGKIYILEVNTAPGMTATSLVPKAANAIGISMPEFVKHIVEEAHL